MIQLALCDHDLEFLLYEQQVVTEYFEAHQIDIEVSVFSSGTRFYHSIAQTHYDIVFLAIDLPDVNGFQIAAQLKQKPDCLLVFVADHDHWALDSFSYHPYHFIHKPKFDFIIQSVLADMVALYRQRRQVLSFSCNREMIKLDVKEICYLESDRNVVIIHTRDQVYRTTATMAKMEHDLAFLGFCRIHAAFMVNLPYIKILSKDITLDDGTVLPISKKYLHSIKARYREFFDHIM